MGIKFNAFSPVILSAQQNSSYEAEQTLKQMFTMRLLSLVILVVVVVFVFIDYVLVQDSAKYLQLNIARVGFVLAFFGPFLFYFFKKNKTSSFLIFIYALGSIIFFYVLSVISGNQSQLIIHNTIGLIFFNAAAILLFRLPYNYVLFITVIIIGLIVKNLTGLNASLPIVFNLFDVLLWYMILMIVTFLIRNQLEGLQKRAFLMQWELQAANQDRYKLFNVVSHDLKNMIAVQTTITDFLKTSIDKMSADDRNTMINLLDNSSKETLTIFDNLMVWIKTQMNLIKTKPISIELNEFLKEQVNYCLPTANYKNVAIAIENEANNNFYSDATILGLVFRNILGNAIKFSHENSQIKIKAIQHKHDLKLQVTDHGLGMSNEKVRNLFRMDYLETTKGTQGENGTGMGLILSRELLMQLNGNIKVESNEGFGTTVFIELPNSYGKVG